MIPLYKPVGKTPLEMIQALQASDARYAATRLGYAGRLDPMAHGLLLILEDDENLKRKEYERLQKEYVVEVVLGIATDTYDAMGMITRTHIPVATDILEQTLQKYIGVYPQPYPPYSSPRVNGKPLFYWAREGRIHEITIPVKEVEIFTLTLEEMRTISAKEIVSTATNNILPVQGEFRQKEIVEGWNQWLSQHADIELPCATIRVSCSSGTYMRSLAHSIGEDLQCGGMAFSITRTRIGQLTLENALRIQPPVITDLPE